nr:immunoglobulin heavy chain junction region [Mus musculus]
CARRGDYSNYVAWFAYW